jgi:hypothetical protein
VKVLAVIRRSPARRFLIELNTKKLIKEVKALISERRNSKAIVTALAKGVFEREVYEDEIYDHKVDMILTEENVHWDLLKK